MSGSDFTLIKRQMLNISFLLHDNKTDGLAVLVEGFISVYCLAYHWNCLYVAPVVNSRMIVQKSLQYTCPCKLKQHHSSNLLLFTRQIKMRNSNCNVHCNPKCYPKYPPEGATAPNWAWCKNTRGWEPEWNTDRVNPMHSRYFIDHIR